MNAIAMFMSNIQLDQKSLMKESPNVLAAIDIEAVSFGSILSEMKTNVVDEDIDSISTEELLEEHSKLQDFKVFLSQLDMQDLKEVVKQILDADVESEQLTLLQTELAAMLTEVDESVEADTFELTEEMLITTLSPTSMMIFQEQYQLLQEDIEIAEWDIELKELDDPILINPKGEQTQKSGLENNDETVVQISSEKNITILTEPVINAADLIRENPEQLKQELQQVIKTAESLLLSIQNGERITKVTPKILALLEQWQKLTGNNSVQASQLLETESTNKELSKAWKELLQAFQKRMSLTNERQYIVDAKVSTKDVANWIRNIVEVQSADNSKPVVMNMQNSQGATIFTPISRAEQFVIHLNQTQSNMPADRQLIQQFEKIMTANRIMHLQKTSGGLNMTLRPQNLGEMVVRFLQVNGEMIVKILVSSTQAKEMLEKNMSQLRSMFSPHQVTVEKQDSVLLQNTESQKYQEQNEDEQEQQNNQQQHHEIEEEDSFLSIFEDVLMNEKV